MRVKILFNKPDTALIQFFDAYHAQTGINLSPTNTPYIYVIYYFKLAWVSFYCYVQNSKERLSCVLTVFPRLSIHKYFEHRYYKKKHEKYFVSRLQILVFDFITVLLWKTIKCGWSK